MKPVAITYVLVDGTGYVRL